jgi:energy-coupling factor transporter ATP-binding protein EcfA2
MQFDPEKITFFGRTDARGKNVAFGIKAKDRQRHVYVIGKTGMGKSTLLENMAVQDIQSGEGMAFIDPHGSAAETLLNYIPEHRVKDVLYFAPADAAHPVSFNIMEDVGPDKRHLVVSGLMSVFKKIWVDAWSARMEYILQNTILALLEYPGSTLIGVNRMLSDKAYRDLVVRNVKDPGVRSFWVDEFAKYNERYMQEAGDAIKNKIGQFTANPIIRNIIGQPKSSFDIRQMMDDRKIIIMNLSKGLIGETNANLLGSMLTTRIYLAAMSRADMSPEKMKTMPNFYFYVDEFQSFANATFANILSEARKYHLNLTIAHQYIEQMEEDVRNAVFGNVGTIIAFRVGPFDAEVLETIFTPQFLATDIVNLGFAQVYLTLMIDGIGSQPFSATTLPPIAPQSISYKEMVIAASREQFARLRADVEIDIEKFHEPVVVEKPVRAAPKVVEGMSTSATPELGSKAKEADMPHRSEPRRDAPRRTEGGERKTIPEGERSTSRTSDRPREERKDDRRREDRRDDRGGERGSERRGGEKASSTRERERAPKQTEEPAPQKKEDHLSELRAALAKIAEGEKQSEKPSEKLAEPVEVQNATDGWVPEEQPVRIPQEVVHGEMSEKERKEVPATASGARDVRERSIHSPRPEPIPERVSIPEPPKERSESTTTSASDRVTPHELERMMRVTTSDKPPY